jgi:hypothetical protein
VQNRYVGDIGDYMKLAVLRALSPGRSLGVAWWLFPDESHNKDGRHLSYLDQPKAWRAYDQPLFDALAAIRAGGQRDVSRLEALLPDALFARELIPSDIRPFSYRPEARYRWFRRTREQLQHADLLFVDPDNGIAPEGFRPTRRDAGKSISFDEISGLARPGRSLVIYHHQTRRPGGHLAELEHLAGRLSTRTECRVSGALRARPWSPRDFFLLDADDQLIKKAVQIGRDWGEDLTWHPLA